MEMQGVIDGLIAALRAFLGKVVEGAIERGLARLDELLRSLCPESPAGAL